MKWFVTAALLLGLISVPVPAAQCDLLVKGLDLPVKAKTRGKPKAVRWEIVDKTLDRLDKSEGVPAECRLTFDQVFKVDREDVYFPLTNTLIRLAPEGTFTGLKFSRH